MKLLQGGDAGTVVNQAILTQGQPAGRRAVRHRQHVPHPRARRGPLRALRRAGARRRSTGELHLDPTAPRHARSTTATCASTTTRRGSPTHGARRARDARGPHRAGVQGPARRREPGHLVARARLPARHHRRRSATTAGSDYWNALRANGVQVVDGWEQAYNSDFSGGGRARATAPLVVSYASSPPAEVVLRRPARRRRRRPSACSTTAATARSRWPGSCAAPKHAAGGRAAHRLPALRAVPGRRPAVRCSCSRSRTGTPLPDGLHEVRGAARRPSRAAGRRTSTPTARTWIDEWTDLVLR